MAVVSGAKFRAWARASGHEVPDEGRIPAEILAAYGAAHPKRPVARGSAVGPLASADPKPPAPPPSEAQTPPEGTPSPPPLPETDAASSPPWVPPAPSPLPQPARGTDGFAIAAVVLGVLPIGGLGLVFGIVALVRIRKSQRRGQGLAVAGMVLGAVWLVLGGFVAIFGEVEEDGPKRAADGTVIARGKLSSRDLRIADCPTSLRDGALGMVEVVPCSEPHQAEVYATFELSEASYPGAARISGLAVQGCEERLGPFLGPRQAHSYDNLTLTPTEDSWRDGYREVTCLVGGPGGTMLPPGSAKAP